MDGTTIERKGFLKWCDWAATAAEWPAKIACVIFGGGMVTIVIAGVIARYVMKNPMAWTEEMARFLMIWMAVIGISIATRRRAHLGVFYFALKLPLVLQRLVKLITDSAIMVFLYYLTVYGVKMVVAAKTQWEPSTGITMNYPLACIPICGILTMFQLALQMIYDFSLWGTKKSPYEV